jgi:hypothetical protein
VQRRTRAGRAAAFPLNRNGSGPRWAESYRSLDAQTSPNGQTLGKVCSLSPTVRRMASRVLPRWDALPPTASG